MGVIMIIKAYNIKESWIFTSENKPSKQLFATILSNAVASSWAPEFVERPDAYTLRVRGSAPLAPLYAYKWNLIALEEENEPNNVMYYVVSNVELIQEFDPNSNKEPIIEITGKIDLYLSFICAIFDEQSPSTIPVFVKQKHLNRYYYVNGNKYVYFSEQFYLKNKHHALNDVGENLSKDAYYVGADDYNQTNAPLLSSGTLINTSYNNATLQNEARQSYLYVLWKMTSNETSQTMRGNAIQWSGLVNMANFPNGSGVNPTCLAWWWLLQNVGAGAYSDIINLPLPVELGYTYNNASVLNIGETFNNNTFTTLGNFAPGTWNSTAGPVWNDCPAEDLVVWNYVPCNIMFLFKQSNATNNEIYLDVSQIFNVEPYLFQYCKMRCRGAGEDAFIDITFFDNFNPLNFVCTLFSFTLSINHPVTQITNINYSIQHYLFSQNLSSDIWLVPWGYNKLNDAYYALNWKSIYPSLSNNWNNYLLNNLNQYHTALNVSHYALQNAQANIAWGAISSLGQIVGDIFDPANWGDLGGAIGRLGEGLTNNSFSELEQQQQYNYLKTGKGQDMSRASNERLATNNNLIAYNNNLLSFVFEMPVQYELNLAINYCLLNGYVLDRWEPFSYWLNRVYCNYYKCAFFSDCLLQNLFPDYKKQIDQILNKGVRVWTNATYTNNISTPTLNLSAFVNNAQAYRNLEINTNNNELTYLNSNVGNG